MIQTAKYCVFLSEMFSRSFYDAPINRHISLQAKIPKVLLLAFANLHRVLLCPDTANREK